MSIALSSLISPHPPCPFLAFSTHISCKSSVEGTGAKLFAAWPTVNFHFDKPCCIVFLLFAVAFSLPPPAVSLNHPAVQPLINEALCVPRSFSLGVFLSSSSLYLLLSCSSSLFGHLLPECCAFYDRSYSESSLSAGQNDRPWSDTMNMLSSPHPPLFLSSPTWIDWHTDGLKGIYCSLCVCEGFGHPCMCE